MTLTLDPAGYWVDSRDPNRTQHFTQLPDGNYRDQHRYDYRYDATTRQYQVLGAQPNQYWDTVGQRQYTKRVENTRSCYVYPNTATVANATIRYRYDPANYRYQPLPGRAWWIDGHGRYVDRYNRVLDPPGNLVVKQYLLAQDTDRNFVLPVKLRVSGKFMPGLPNLPGGNMDPTDADEHAAAARELREETDFLITADTSQPRSSTPSGSNLMCFRVGTVRATTFAEQAARPLPPPAEMDYAVGPFRFRASAITYQPGHTTDLQIRTEILGLFAADKHVDLTAAFFTTPRGDPPRTPLEEFHESDTIAALVAKIKEDH